MSETILSLHDLRVQFKLAGKWLGARPLLRAVDGINLEVQAGEIVGIVGESGCGKSTLARAVLQLVRPSSGTVVWMGQSIGDLSAGGMRPLRRDMQIVFQDPLASLNPRMTIGDCIAEPLRVHAPQLGLREREAAVADMLGRVGLSRDMINRYPHEFSGGQCQRVGIARAMILKPKLLICDEPVSALDVSIQAQIINLLKDLQRDFGMTILFVSHNLAVVRRLCNRVLVLYLGRAMELADTESLFTNALHPYTRGLLAAVPIPDPDLQPARLAATLGGELPSPTSPPSGCVFRTRCAGADELCTSAVPDFIEIASGLSQRGSIGLRQIACHHWEKIPR